MPPSLIAPLILSLSLDTFAVSTAVGMAPLPRPARLRFAAACTLAEAGMPLIGLVLGGVVGRVAGVVEWLAVALLLGAGLWTVREAFEDEDETAEAAERAEQGGLALLAAALSVSMDELAVGIVLGALRLPVAPVVAAIAAQALLASLLGLWLGKQLGARAGACAALLSGAVLCAVALWLVALQMLGRA